MFITFEGIDGCGKSTQAKLLYEAIKENNIPVILTREPGEGANVGNVIREMLLSVDMDITTEFLLFASDRNEHFLKVIMPNLKSGKIVISDRFADSSVAYQGYGRGVSIEFINFIHDYITSFKKPDLTFFIDVNPLIGLKRLKKHDRIEKSGIELLEKVRNGYYEIIKNDKRFVLINGERDIDDIQKEVWGIFIQRREEWIRERR